MSDLPPEIAQDRLGDFFCPFQSTQKRGSAPRRLGVGIRSGICARRVCGALTGDTVGLANRNRSNGTPAKMYRSPSRPKTQRIAKEKLGRYLQIARLDDELTELVRDLVPQAWHRLEHDIDVEEPKVKITLRLDRSVAKFYRAWGNGYQARINRILATYAQARIAEFLKMEKEFYEYVELTLDKYNDQAPEDIEQGPKEGEV